MSGVLLVLQFVFAILITIVVMMQKSSSMGLGAYSGSNESLFGAKGPAGFLAKLTFGLGLLFVLNTIALGYLYVQDAKRSIIDGVEIPTNSVPAVPIVPSSQLEPQAPIAPVNTESK
ncbi:MULTISPECIES: preprotein translocase subunit SecG [Pseudomonadati]|uniref:preprotein translocase subunit SecG n=1 Tax=Pseudomonadati TaxID=3379134 RepID=UPI0023F1D960|nr:MULTISPECIES: preprotein translocase subunit SecG [Bacteria]MCI5968539.1 preprotein translocase subunit SecG [Helicobacter sp.]MDD6911350.1 preprotein translocase subunit SecG [Actinobacillus minor]MDY2584749.1 preprotein translocase subunit SecG [Helicobacter sp.]